MAEARRHYEDALAAWLRALGVPHLGVDETRRACSATTTDPPTLKSFDAVLFGPRRHLLIEVKGRKLRARPTPKRAGAPAPPRFDAWTTLADVESLGVWERLFGEPYTAALAFVFWCDRPPAAALFEGVFEHRGRWYQTRVVTLAAYRASMRTRSPRWRTVAVPHAEFERVSIPLSAAGVLGPGTAPASGAGLE
ncbi:MAG: HYExAFE family protein [Planctomycetota bacterium]